MKIQEYNSKMSRFPIYIIRDNKLTYINSVKNSEIPNDYYGLEWEVEFKNMESLKSFVYLIGVWNKKYSFNDRDIVFLKEDGSLSNGVEMCFTPLPITFFTSEAYNELCKIVKEYTSISSRCGIHISMNNPQRPNISEIDRLNNIIWLMKLIETDKTGFIRNVMRREFNHYCFIPNIYDYSEDEEDEYDPYEDHHCFVSFDCNSGRIEFRVFRSTNQRDVLAAYIYFLNTMIYHVANINKNANISEIKNLLIENAPSEYAQIVLSKLIEGEYEPRANRKNSQSAGA